MNEIKKTRCPCDIYFQSFLIYTYIYIFINLSYANSPVQAEPARVLRPPGPSSWRYVDCTRHVIQVEGRCARSRRTSRQEAQSSHNGAAHSTRRQDISLLSSCEPQLNACVWTFIYQLTVELHSLHWPSNVSHADFQCVLRPLHLYRSPSLWSSTAVPPSPSLGRSQMNSVAS